MYRRKDRYLINQFISKQPLAVEDDISSVDRPVIKVPSSSRFHFSWIFWIFFINHSIQLIDFYVYALKHESEKQIGLFSSWREFSKVYGIEAQVLIDELGRLGFKFDAKAVKAFKDSFEEEKNNLLIIIVRECDKLKGKIKALSSPLHIIPQSLRPIESVAR